jgi:hypothetical protein
MYNPGIRKRLYVQKGNQAEGIVELLYGEGLCIHQAQLPPPRTTETSPASGGAHFA